MNGSESILLLEQDECVRDKIKQKRRRDGLHVMATGGGAYKFYDKIRDRLGVDMYREDEMECLIVGLPSSLPLRFGYQVEVVHGSAYIPRRSAC